MALTSEELENFTIIIENDAGYVYDGVFADGMLRESPYRRPLKLDDLQQLRSHLSGRRYCGLRWGEDPLRSFILPNQFHTWQEVWGGREEEFKRITRNYEGGTK